VQDTSDRNGVGCIGRNGGVRVLAVVHSRFVPAEQGRRDAHRKREPHEQFTALQRLPDDPAGLLEAGIAGIDLQVLLGLVVRVADAAVDELAPRANLAQSLDFTHVSTSGSSRNMAGTLSFGGRTGASAGQAYREPRWRVACRRRYRPLRAGRTARVLERPRVP